MIKPKLIRNKIKDCYVCKNNVGLIDYKDTELLKKFISSYAKIMPKRRTGTCARHQRALGLAVKNARLMGFLPYVVE